MNAVDREHEILVGRSGRADRQRLPPNSELAGRDLEVPTLQQDRRADVAGACLDHAHGLLDLFAHHDDLSWFDDARFLRRNLGHRVAELTMVQGDGAKNRDVAPDKVCGVPGAAHPHLEHTERDRFVGEPQERECREDLEVRDP